MKPGTQRTNLANVLRYAVSHPRAVTLMIRKLLKRFEAGGRYTAEDNAKWIGDRAQSPADYARAIDPGLWREATQFGKRLRDRARAILAEVPFDMGAGGDYEFLYWITRKLKPEIVVETGVSAGWSSQAFLAALDRNGSGRLLSSDFPYFRIQNPEQYIGVLVEESLKHRWQLFTDGDENALPRIVSQVRRIDLFHYDSDKSYSGRCFASRLVQEKLTGPMLVDDILNDSWFREFVERDGVRYSILTNADRHCLGMIEADELPEHRQRSAQRKRQRV